ncbi:hypothetical protein [Halosimplex salinum]|uniref:hypothetical protein n=1 Tax=Halosimplex salinum TaxID=1710538 RepID=UPI000F474BD0|nr:hypothetical protein [Halosimplex salinum]
MGIYKRLSAVPDHLRLREHADAYAGRDVWSTFLSEYLFQRFDSDRFKEDARRAGRYWKEHMAERGRHHALATPADVEAWMVALTNRMQLETAYNQYWVRVERFYWWLQRHTDHPHAYHPVLMAAASGGVAGDVWEEKLSRRHGRGNR